MCPGVIARFFRTAPEILQFLASSLQTVDMMSLDHDLEPDGRYDDAGTGRDVTDYLVKQRPTCPVIVHSSNLHAATAMEYDLSEAGWHVLRVAPYGDLEWISATWIHTIAKLAAR
jgi:hypothetical protein